MYIIMVVYKRGCPNQHTRYRRTTHSTINKRRYYHNESTAGADASVEASYNVASYAGLYSSLKKACSCSYNQR